MVVSTKLPGLSGINGTQFPDRIDTTTLRGGGGGGGWQAHGNYDSHSLLGSVSVPGSTMLC